MAARPPDFIPADATPDQMRDLLTQIDALLLRQGYEANGYLDLPTALYDLIVDFQRCEEAYRHEHGM